MQKNTEYASVCVKRKGGVIQETNGGELFSEGVQGRWGTGMGSSVNILFYKFRVTTSDYEK